MPRPPRFVLPGLPQHVIQRGNNRQPVFAAADDYRYFLDALHGAAQRHGCRIHAYVLMTNHVHLLATPEDTDGIGKMMQAAGRRYVPYFNRKYGRTGTLWEGRYRASLVDSEQYLLVCMRYIELNPVRARMVGHPVDYPWSSFRHNAEGHPDAIVQPQALYLALGDTAPIRQGAYRELFRNALPSETSDMIRNATNSGWALGSDGFKQALAAQLPRSPAPLIRGGDHRSAEFKSKRDDQA